MFENTKAFSGFSVDDLGKAQHFYGETLGIEVTQEPPHGLLTLQIAGDRPILIYPKGIFRQGGPLIAWFKDPAGNVLSVIQQR